MSAPLPQGLIDYLGQSPSPFHATANLARLLESQGYVRLLERDSWQLKHGGRYYVTRNDSSLIAWQMGQQDPSENGLRMVGAHTDSPCLKVKPNPELLQQGYWQLGVEVYGGVLLAPWFDRDLSLAGRVTFRKDGAIDSRLVDFQRPIAVIPNLAIHLNREANDSQSINKQTDLPPLLACVSGAEAPDFRSLLAERIEQEHGLTVDQVLDYEMNFYDTQAAAVIGLENDFIAGARLDNLLSCYAGAQALQDAAEAGQWAVLICTDHEEVGSSSHCGADGPMLEQVLRRVLGDDESFTRTMQRSILISADNAHGIHPNYPDRHDNNHGPRLNQGPVIKINHNQRYASTSETSGLFRQLCLEAEVPVQSFVVRSDMACGSTIGPITSSQVGVRTVDIGVPTFAMHSIRELAGSQDLSFLVKVLSHFYRLEQLP